MLSRQKAGARMLTVFIGMLGFFCVYAGIRNWQQEADESRKKQDSLQVTRDDILRLQQENAEIEKEIVAKAKEIAEIKAKIEYYEKRSAERIRNFNQKE